MYTCAHCTVHACFSQDFDKMPKNCPMRNEEVNDEVKAIYQQPFNKAFHTASSEIEVLGYCRWPRLKETVEFCKRMGFTRVGLAFCIGLRKEARIVADVFRDFGLDVVSVVCKTGAISKEWVGVPEENKFLPGKFEAMCNPVAQALFLNEQKTELNVALGLCVGHDSLFYKYSDAMVTTLVAKDRATGHNPAAAIYCAYSYFDKRLSPGYEY